VDSGGKNESLFLHYTNEEDRDFENKALCTFGKTLWLLSFFRIYFILPFSPPSNLIFLFL